MYCLPRIIFVASILHPAASLLTSQSPVQEHHRATPFGSLCCTITHVRLGRPFPPQRRPVNLAAAGSCPCRHHTDF